MDFSWTEEQEAIKRRSASFASENLNEGFAEREREGSFSHESWRKCAGEGVLGLPFPRQYGGAEADIFSTLLSMEGLGYGTKDHGLLFALNAQMWAVQHPIAALGTPEQKEKYLAPLIRGEILGAHGMTEPEAGSDAYSLETRAEKCAGGYELNGHKVMITNAPVCDIAIVFATTNPKRGMWGVSAFLVERGMPGFHTSGCVDKMGMRTAAMGELSLEACIVPEENRLGSDGAGWRVFESSMEWERSCILACQIGAMERQVEQCVAYAKQRRQFRQAIGKFQAVSHRLADMKVRLEASRLLLYRTAWSKQSGCPSALDAAVTKLFLSESYVASSLDAIRTFGGRGYLREYGMEQELRDAVGGTLYSGTSDIQRNIIAHQLGVAG